MSNASVIFSCPQVAKNRYMFSHFKHFFRKKKKAKHNCMFLCWMRDCDLVLVFLLSDGVHRRGHPVVPVGLTDGQPAQLRSEQPFASLHRFSPVDIKAHRSKWENLMTRYPFCFYKGKQMLLTCFQYKLYMKLPGFGVFGVFLDTLQGEVCWEEASFLC